MRAWAPLLAIAGACGFQPSGSVDGKMPIDASDANDADPRSDMDNDGVPDSVDNCPSIANGDQLDHDHDGHGDPCDKCPHLPSAADPDSDGDGVGDACDPRPNTPGDHRVFFEGFYDTNAVTSWTRGGVATWNISLGAVHQDDPNTGDALLIAPSSYTRLYAAVGFKITALPASASSSSIGFCSGALPGNAQYYCCTITGGGTEVRASSSVAVAALQPWTGSFALGDSIELVQNLAAKNSCEATQGAHDVTAMGNVGATNGSFELYTGAAGAAFDYVFLVEVGP